MNRLGFRLGLRLRLRERRRGGRFVANFGFDAFICSGALFFGRVVPVLSKMKLIHLDSIELFSAYICPLV